jgi:hypothetical protein
MGHSQQHIPKGNNANHSGHAPGISPGLGNEDLYALGELWFTISAPTQLDYVNYDPQSAGNITDQRRLPSRLYFYKNLILFGFVRAIT